MTDSCVIFAGGDAVAADTVDREAVEKAYVICADKGLSLARSMGIEPDLILGDFDSLKYTPEGSNVMTYPSEKDDTDLMLAVSVALEKGFTEFIIYGACGGRLDHMMGNIACLAMIAEGGARGVIVGDDDIISLHTPGSYSVPYKKGFSLSLFAYSPEVSGLTITGTKYTAYDCCLSNRVTLGVSNEITSDHAQISFSDGRLLVIQSRLDRQ